MALDLQVWSFKWALQKFLAVAGLDQIFSYALGSSLMQRGGASIDLARSVVQKTANRY
jgi:hypothetical protein